MYDALNVLYASGVLKKDGKHVSCDIKAKEMLQVKINEKQSSSSSSKFSPKGKVD